MQSLLQHTKRLTDCMISKEHRIEALRFISTLLIYGRQYLDWKQDEKSTAIVSYYAELSSTRDYFRPLITAIYASKLPLDAQVSVYSRFLEGKLLKKEKERRLKRL